MVIKTELVALSMRRSLIIMLIVIMGLFAEFAVQMYKLRVVRNIDTISSFLKVEIEESFREHARFDLQQAKMCINSVLKSDFYKNDGFDDRLFKVVDVCAKQIRTTSTGDVFMFDLNTGKFLYDPSLDCYVNTGKVFADKESSIKLMQEIKNNPNTDYPECCLHKDQERCYIARDKMFMGYDSRRGDNNWFQFDDSIEWLEYVVLPVEYEGFDQKPRGTNTSKPKQYMLALGIQSDEVDKQFERSNKFIGQFMKESNDINLILWAIRILLSTILLYTLYLSYADKRAYERIINATKI